MSLNPEFDRTPSYGQQTNGAEAEVRNQVAVAEPAADQPAYAPQVYAPPGYAPPPAYARPWDAQAVVLQTLTSAGTRKSSRWIVPAAIAIVGLIASGTLGGFLYATIGQRDAARHQLASTQATLADTDKQLAARKATDAYLDMYVVNSGRVMTEYQNAVACDSYVTCRTAAQDLVSALKAFQTARSSIVVPSALANADSQIGDALSAAIAGGHEWITGMDTNDMAKIKDGGKKVDDAMLSLAKAESALATVLR